MSAILPFVRHSTARFVKADSVREVVSLGLVSGKNFILFGPGGHGKSEMLDAIFSNIKDASCKVQMFGEGMDEARLYGGINLKKINDPDSPAIVYHPERSFLSWDYAIFEELFDAPTMVLLSLKDTLTAACLRNGEQQFSMQTKVIACATNREPAEVASAGTAAQALIERFPLQLRVKWDSYKSEDYRQMFNQTYVAAASTLATTITNAELTQLRSRASSAHIPMDISNLLASLIASLVEKGGVVAPRTAMYARDVIKASAAINNRDVVTKEDLLTIKYLPGCEEIAAGLEKELATLEIKNKALETIGKLRTIFTELQETYQSCKSPIDFLKISKKAADLARKAAAIQVDDSLYAIREDVVTKLNLLSSQALVAATNATKTE